MGSLGGTTRRAGRTGACAIAALGLAIGLTACGSAPSPVHAPPTIIPAPSSSPAATTASAKPAVKPKPKPRPKPPAPPVTTQAAAPVQPPAPVHTSAPTHPAPPPPTHRATPPSQSCYPLSDEGTCYEPGEYCRDDDHGMTGRAGDGETIRCEDNDGWR